MLSFFLGMYVLGFIVAFLIFFALTMLGGKSKSKILIFFECLLFAIFWPVGIFLLNKI